MRCGAATVDITPGWPVDLSGYVARLQPSTGVRDRLAARSLYLEGDGGRLLWLHADVIGFERAFHRRLLERLPALEPREVLLTATHTHSGPATARLINCGDPDEAYLDHLLERLLAAAVESMASMEQSRMVVGRSRVDLARDRRGKPSAHVDPTLSAFGWRRPDGTYRAAVSHYAMHNVSLGHNNRSVSGDVAGEVARRLTDSLPGKPVVLAANGACGNINPPAVRDDDALTTEWAGSLTEAAMTALGAAEPVGEEVRTAFREMDAVLEYPSVEAIRANADRHRKGLEGQTGYTADRIRGAIDRWEGRALAEISAPTAEGRLPLAVHAVSLGGVPMIGVAGEVFSVMTDWLAESTGRAVTVLGYANGDIGYLAPDAAYDEGGYEVDGAHMFYGTLPIPRGTFERVEALAAELLSEVM